MTDAPDERRTGLPTSPRAALLLGAATACLLFGGLGGWAATAELASAVVAPGVFVVEGDRKLVQHPDGGVVGRLLVQDGDLVEAGQVLLRLDDTQVRATLGVLRANLDAALAERARLIAEREDHEEIDFPDELLRRREDPGVAELLLGQWRLFEARRAAFEGRVKVLRQRIAQLEEEISGIEAQQRAKEHQVAFIEQELEGQEQLYAKGLTQLTRVLALKRDAARLQGERGEHVAAIARARKAIGEAELEILQSGLQRQEEVSGSLREVQTRILDLLERFAAARDRVDKIALPAPSAGVVVGLAITTEGAVLKPGDTVLEIVPQDNRLVVEAKLRPQDIDSVAIGQAARLRLVALSQRTTPTLDGRLVYVSADRLEEPRSGDPYFLARVELEPGQLARIDAAPLLPGMPAEVMIETGAHTALDYLIQPVSDTFARAWREN